LHAELYTFISDATGKTFCTLGCRIESIVTHTNTDAIAAILAVTIGVAGLRVPYDANTGTTHRAVTIGGIRIVHQTVTVIIEAVIAHLCGIWIHVDIQVIAILSSAGRADESISVTIGAEAGTCIEFVNQPVAIVILSIGAILSRVRTDISIRIVAVGAPTGDFRKPIAIKICAARGAIHDISIVHQAVTIVVHTIPAQVHRRWVKCWVCVIAVSGRTCAISIVVAQ
jgi:hypothetical protein